MVTCQSNTLCLALLLRNHPVTIVLDQSSNPSNLKRPSTIVRYDSDTLSLPFAVFCRFVVHQAEGDCFNTHDLQPCSWTTLALRTLRAPSCTSCIERPKECQTGSGIQRLLPDLAPLRCAANRWESLGLSARDVDKAPAIGTTSCFFVTCN